MNKIQLKPLKVTDITNEYVNWLNDSEVTKYLETKSATHESIKSWIENKLNTVGIRLYGIWIDNIMIGTLKIDMIELIDRDYNYSGWIALMIGNKNYWNKGLGKKAINLAIKDNPDIKVWKLGVATENIPAIRCYENIGFRAVKLEKNALNNGKYDKLIMKYIKRE
jgi:RimJ/RimL family protein N-acetyltransferase